MCGHAFKTSAEIAAGKGPFAGFAKNREPMLRVMRMHRDAAYEIDRDASLALGLSVGPPAPTVCAGGAASDLYPAARDHWGGAVRLGEPHRYRNPPPARLAPPATI